MPPGRYSVPDRHTTMAATELTWSRRKIEAATKGEPTVNNHNAIHIA